MLRTQSTHNFSVAEHYGSRNTTCLYSKDVIFFIQYIFRPVFGRFCLKSAAVRPPNFPGQSLFYSAGFVLFCRIFGRLATVLTVNHWVKAT
jgi:hypothetical protein